MALHKDLAAGQIHVPYQWIYADATARGAATGFASGDVGKLALQTDDSSLWILTATTPTWVEVGGSGGGAVDSVNGATGVVVLDADDIDDTSTANKWATAAELTKLTGIEAGADVTDATNVDAAGAVMAADTSTAGMGFVVDEDDLSSDLATKVPTQQSVKAYVDAAVIAAGSYTDEKAQDAVGGILTDSSTLNFTYDDIANTITADVTLTARLTVVIDGGGAAITTGVKVDIEAPYACTVTGWRLVADQAGSIVLDLWKDSYANYPPTVADTITGTEKPTLSAAAKAEDTALSTWTTSLSKGDWIRVNVDSAATITRATLSVLVNRTGS